MLLLGALTNGAIGMSILGYPRTSEMSDLLALRQRFLATGECAEGLRPLVRAAWERCRAYGLDPRSLPRQTVDPEALRRAHQRSRQLLAAADPFLRRVHETLGDQPHLIALADREGIILGLLADPTAREHGAAANLFEGASWEERACGCNGAGTALATGQPLVLIGPEHFMDAHVGWTSVGIPLRDPIGQLVGALDLSVPNEQISLHSWGWMLSIGQGVEAGLATSGATDTAEADDQTALAMAKPDSPLQTLRGAWDLLAQQLAMAPTHARLVEEARASIEQAEAQLEGVLGQVRRSETRHRTLFDSMTQGVIYRDAAGRITAVNPAVEGILGLTRDQLLGQTSLDPNCQAIHEDGSPFSQDDYPATAALQTGGEVRGVTMGVFNPRESQYRWILVNAVPWFRAGEQRPYQVFTTLEDITACKATERALSESSDRLAVALHGAPILIFNHDRHLRYTWMEQVVPHFETERLLGKTDAEVLPGAVAEPIMAIKRRALETGSRVRAEVAFPVSIDVPDADGGIYDLTAEPLRDADGAVIGLTCVAVDITARRQMEQALERSEARWRRLADANLIGVIFWDLDGMVTDANEAFLEMVGYSRDDLRAGRVRWTEMTPPEYRQSDEEGLEELRIHGVRGPLEKEYRRKDGTRVAVLLGSAMFEGSTREGVSFVLDLTESRRMARAEREARAQAEDAVRARDAFLALVTHDLRNPLTAVRGYAQLMQRRGVYIERAVEQILTQTHHQERLIGDLLDVAQLEAGRLELRRQQCDLLPIVRTAVAQTRTASRQHTIRRRAPGKPLIGTWDPDRLSQILQNLLSNAVKYSPDASEIQVVVERSASEASVSIRDQGLGISPEALPRLFDRFYRGHAAGGQVGGLGLGLAIVKGLVEAHGGQISVESAPGQGSTFRFTLPLDRQSNVSEP